MEVSLIGGGNWELTQRKPRTCYKLLTNWLVLCFSEYCHLTVCENETNMFNGNRHWCESNYSL